MEKKKRKTVYKGTKLSWKRDFKRNWPVYVLFLPIFIYQLVLHYFPMFGIVMAFENFNPVKGYFGSEWVGFDNFRTLFTGSEFLTAIRNTICIGLINNTIGFCLPIIFAFLLTSLRNRKYKRTIQTFSYLPNFVAAVVVCALVREFLAADGPITLLLSKVFGLPEQNWVANESIPIFWVILLLMGAWQGIGWGSIMYVAAISTVSGDLHEAAAIDGATRFQRLTKITLPCIMPTIVMMFIIGIGTSFSVGGDNILLLYMPSTYKVADTVSTYTYRMAFSTGSNYGLSSASGLFQSIVCSVMLLGSNYISKKKSNMSLF